MIIRQSLNFAVHLAAGIAFGALAVAMLAACAQARGRGRPAAEPLEPVEPVGT
jgi:hypothetical protein